MITLQPGDSPELAYDGGSVRFLAAGKETQGAWSLVQLKQMPGYHTNVHRHVFTDEAFYVLEGVLTVKMNGKTTEFPAGSYVLVPHGTPHAQGNLGKVPVKLLLTMTPGGFERSFMDRVELNKTVRPNDPNFRKEREANRVKGNYDVVFIEAWEPQK